MSYGHELSEQTQTNLPIQNIVINFQVFGYFKIRLRKHNVILSNISCYCKENDRYVCLFHGDCPVTKGSS